MTSPRFSFRLAWLILVGITWPSAARADDARLQVIQHGDPLPAAALHDALVKELGREVELAEVGSATERLTITWRRETHELAVSYDVGARTVARIVTAPDSSARVIDDAALLAANLVHQGLPPPDADPRPAPPAVAPVPVAAPVPAPVTEPDSETAVVSVAYPLASNVRRPWVRTAFELDLLYGRIGALEGLQLGTLGLVLGSRSHPAATGSMQGAQIAALASVASGRATGLQLAFFTAVAGGGLSGVQVAGVTVAAGAVRGVQLGVVNVASGTVRGAQVGLVNYAKDIQGVPFGLVSVTESGGIHPVAWSSSSSFGNLGVKFATKHTYTIPYLTMHHAYDRVVLGGGGAVGARLPLGRYLAIEIDVAFTYLRAVTSTPSVEIAGSSYAEQLFQPRLRGAFHVAPQKHFSLFVGAGVVPEVRLRDVSQTVDFRTRPEVFGGIQL